MRFLQIGVGGFGRCWVDALKTAPTAEVVGLVDISDTALAAACQTGGYTPDICFHSLEEALAKVSAEAAVVVTPPARHETDVVGAMRAGLDVISEKPMSDSMAACKRMLKAALETGRTYAVSQNYRYFAPAAAMHDLLADGTLGDAGQVTLDFFKGHDFHGGFRHDMDYPLVIDMSIHHFDLIRFITGLDAESVQATAWNPRWSNYRGDCSSTAVFAMSNGARVVYNASWCAKGQFCDWSGNWRIECDRGTVVYSNGAAKVFDVPELYTVAGEREIPLTEPPQKAQHQVLTDFVDAVAAGRRPKTDVLDNIRSITMVFATVEAMRSGQTVPVLDAETRELLALS